MAKDTVKLISAEGFEFVVDYQAACVSNTIKNMLSSSGMELSTTANTARLWNRFHHDAVQAASLRLN